MTKLKKMDFVAEGMTCRSCEKIIERQAKKISGVKEIHISYENEEGWVKFDPKLTDMGEILSKIDEKGYTCRICDENSINRNNKKNYKTFSLIAGAFVLLFGIYLLFNNVIHISIPEINENMGYGFILVIGLLTGFHCVGMCGGFVMSYTSKNTVSNKKSNTKQSKHNLSSHLSYAFGKTITYTFIGALFGLIGSVFTFSPALRGWIAFFAGLFLVVYGLNMLNIFPWLRRFQIKTPSFISKFVSKESKQHSNPFVIGLLNGLMIACGPLQAMYIYAAGTGSVFKGALSLLVFGIGTLPVLLGFGIVASLISAKFTHKIVKVSAVVVILLGVIMLNRGLSLSGSGYDYNSITTKMLMLRSSAPESDMVGNDVIVGGMQEIEMTVDRYGYRPDSFVLEKGIPVKWKIDAKELTGCNREIIVPDYDIDMKLSEGMNIVEFVPNKAGVVSWSCWMGMIRGSFTVKDDGGEVSASPTGDAVKRAASTSAPTLSSVSTSSCGGSCGSPTCGAGGSGSCGCGGR